MSEHNTDSARSRQVQMNVNPPVSYVAVIMAMGGGVIPPPEIGDPTAEVLGALMGRDADVIRDWVHKYKVKCRMPAGENGQMWIDLADFRKKVPHIVPVKRTRGGSKKKE